MSQDQRALERLMARVDQALTGELDDSQLRELEAHLDGCEACASEIEQVRLLRRLLQSSCCQVAPESLRQKIQVVRREYRVSQGPHGSQVSRTTLRFTSEG